MTESEDQDLLARVVRLESQADHTREVWAALGRAMDSVTPWRVNQVWQLLRVAARYMTELEKGEK